MFYTCIHILKCSLFFFFYCRAFTQGTFVYFFFYCDKSEKHERITTQNRDYGFCAEAGGGKVPKTVCNSCQYEGIPDLKTKFCCQLVFFKHLYWGIIDIPKSTCIFMKCSYTHETVTTINLIDIFLSAKSFFTYVCCYCCCVHYILFVVRTFNVRSNVLTDVYVHNNSIIDIRHYVVPQISRSNSSYITEILLQLKTNCTIPSSTNLWYPWLHFLLLWIWLF